MDLNNLSLSAAAAAALYYNHTFCSHVSPHPLVLPLSSVKAVGVRVLPSRSEGFLPARPGPEQKPARCGSKVTNKQCDSVVKGALCLIRCNQNIIIKFLLL